MFRARKPSVKRPLKDELTPRKRAKLERSERVEPAAAAKPAPAKDAGVALPLPAVGPSKAVIEECTRPRVAADKSKRELLAPKPVESPTQSATPNETKDILSVKTAPTDEHKPEEKATVNEQVEEAPEEKATVDEQDDESPADEVTLVQPPVLEVYVSKSARTADEQSSCDDEGYETAKGDDCDVQGKQDGNISEKAETTDSSAQALWPPYDVKDEEFVSVRKERVIESKSDSLLDSVLTLLP